MRRYSGRGFIDASACRACSGEIARAAAPPGPLPSSGAGRFQPWLPPTSCAIHGCPGAGGGQPSRRLDRDNDLRLGRDDRRGLGLLAGAPSSFWPAAPAWPGGGCGGGGGSGHCRRFAGDRCCPYRTHVQHDRMFAVEPAWINTTRQSAWPIGGRGLGAIGCNGGGKSISEALMRPRRTATSSTLAPPSPPRAPSRHGGSGGLGEAVAPRL